MFYDIFCELCQNNGLTPSGAAKKIGFNRASVTMWKNSGKAPKQELLVKIANYFGVSTDYLLGKEKIQLFDVKPIAESVMKNIVPYRPSHEIPILGRISAGLPLYAEEQVEGYTFTELNGGAEYFALRVTGDSMTAARINEGDLLIVRRQETVESGQIAVVMVGDDEATVKRFYQTDDTVTLMPQSVNPVHQPQVYDMKKTRVRIIGLVVKIEITL